MTHFYQCVALAATVTYVFLVFSSTVFCRNSTMNYTYEWMPFWSYVEIAKGNKSLLCENLLNIMMLIPVGFFWVLVWLDTMEEKALFRLSVLSGFFISAGIEFSQLFLKKGLFEFDDMIHNTLGAMIGGLVAIGIGAIWKGNQQSVLFDMDQFDHIFEEGEEE